jgi:predicted O-methyltransferase YrrM
VRTGPGWFKLIAADPAGAFSRLRGEWDRRRDLEDWKRVALSPREFYKPSADAEERLHRLLGLPWPCPEHVGLAQALQALETELARSYDERTDRDAEAKRVLPLFDADVTVARVAWCVTRHLRPSNVVETGVARGITSRFILQALERNESGHLWSVDLPHADTARHDQIGSAVPNNLRVRWTLLLGSSRRHLPELVDRLESIDMFVHDSLHTGRNVRFELERVWDRLRPGGIIIVDDVNENLAFQSFVKKKALNRWVVGARLRGMGLWGAIVKQQQ